MTTNLNEFTTRYSLVPNHFNPDGPNEGTMFETFGREHDFVCVQKPERIWTLVEAEGKGYLISGYHFVNRLGYFITNEDVRLEDKETDFLYY